MFTAEGHISGMEFHVNLTAVIGSERFFAVRTAEGLLLSMHSQVLLKVAFKRKDLVTDGTLEWFRSGM